MGAEKKELIVLGIRLGSAGHMFATKVADAVNKNVPEVSVTVMTGSSQENPLNVQKKRGHIGFTSSEYATWAYEGERDFKGMPCKDLRHFFFFSINLENFLVRADSNIRKIEDLYNKKLNLGPKGYGLTEVGLTVLQVYGFTPDVIRKNGGNVSFASDQDAGQMIQDRVIDAMFAHTGKSALISQVLPIEQAVGLRPLPYDRDKVKEIVRVLGRGVIMEIDGGVYKAEPNPVLSIGAPYSFVIHKDVEDELAYKMTRAIFKNQKEILDAVGPFFKPFRIENALLGADIPIHPGALKYYREVGITK
jgi:TRAP transporter TAXI family solute receptor